MNAAARKVPALLAFLNFIRAQRQVLSEADWIAKFGRVHGRIAEQILPRFAYAEIEESELGGFTPRIVHVDRTNGVVDTVRAQALVAP